MFTTTNSRGRPFGPDGCQVPVGLGTCGETGTLDIINEFKRLYEEKMHEIDTAGGGDYLQEKVKLQQEWISDLSDQNEMLVRAVEELEHEATERVRILEEKLQKSAQCLCEEKEKLKITESSIKELEVQIGYFKSFGDVEGMAKELNCKRAECENLKTCCQQKDAQQEILVIRAKSLERKNYTLESTLKEDKDQINKLEKKFYEFLKYKDELKQKYKESENKYKCACEENVKHKTEILYLQKMTMLLEKDLKSAQEAMENFQHKSENCNCRIQELTRENEKIMKEMVELNEENRNLMKTLDAQKKTLVNTARVTQEEAIKLKSTIDDLQMNLQKTKEVREEEEARNRETLEKLKNTIQLLTSALKELETKYEKDVKVCKICKGRCKVGFLENAEVQACFEEEQLQKQMEALENKEEIIKVQGNTLDLMQQELLSLKQAEYEVRNDRDKMCQVIQALNQRIVDLENELKNSEEKAANLQMAEAIKRYKCHLRKLLKQKKGYEEVILYFKEEMTLMAEQLCNLQELLTLSNESSQEETNKLMQAFMNVQSLNDKLSTQLSAAEQKVLLENQMNQLHEAKINELQQIISERDLDLTRHDEAILNIRQTLQCSLKQNEELQATIVALHDTIAPLQEAIKKYEMENCKSKESTQVCLNQITTCRDKLEELKAALDKKTSEMFKLEMAYNNQNRALKTAQIELKQMKDRQKNKQCHMKGTIEVLRDKLVKAEEDFSKLRDEFAKVQAQLTALARKEAVKDMEVKRYRGIVGDLRNTLIELNKTLTNREVQALKHQGKCKNAECRKNMKLTGEAKNLTDVCLNCPCEVEFYQSIVETLKKSVIDLKSKLADTQQRNRQLEEDSKRKEAQLAEHLEKDKEYQELRKKLTDKLKQTQAEEARYLEMAAQFEKELNSVREELEVKTHQLDEVKKSAQEINSSRCIQLACAQEEVNNLKDELNGLLRKHRALNTENEKLHSQSARMQSTVATLEERSQLLKSQLEQYLLELQTVQSDKEALMKKNRDLLAELRCIQGSYSAADKQQREIQCQHLPPCQRPCTRVVTPCMKANSPPPMCQSPWSLGSQGTASVHDIHSPSRSPYPDENTDWYSPTFRNESEEEEEDWVSKVENLAAQVRKTNKMWKNKMGQPDYGVSRDTKK